MTSASAALELAALVAAMRDDWDSNEVSRALASAHSAGWSFGQAAIVLIGLAVTEGTEPADLTSGGPGGKARRWRRSTGPPTSWSRSSARCGTTGQRQRYAARSPPATGPAGPTLTCRSKRSASR